MVVRPTVLAAHLNEHGMGGCEHYRFRIPFEEIRRRVYGSTLDWAPIGQVRQWAASNARIKPTDYDILLLPRHRPLPYEADNFAIGNVSQELLTAIEGWVGVTLDRKSHLLDLVRLLKTEQAIVLEYDDDYWTRSRDLDYDYPELLQQLMGEVDAVTVSTPHLRRLVQWYGKGTPVYVLPNCVNWGEWQGWERWDVWPKDHIVLGLTGSETHEEDWRVLETVLPRVLREHGNVALLLGGYEPEYLKGLKHKFQDQVVVQPPVDYMRYPGLIRQADVVLCPVEPDDEFNQSKSAIKAIEGLASGRLVLGGNGGAVPITSDLYYYRRVTGGDKRGLTVAHTPDAWYEAITTLVTDKQLRTRLSRKGWAWCHDKRAIERTWSQWWRAYQKIRRKR